VYDRAGHGRSDAASAGGADPARDLHALLEQAHVPGPYVLAGHSLGGILALDYTRRYSGEVGGIVLLDSMHPRQTNVFARADRLLGIVPTLARTNGCLRRRSASVQSAPLPVRAARRRVAADARGSAGGV
jgi:pimeloyl-ACP methyl ester carboxylesterase